MSCAGNRAMAWSRAIGLAAAGVVLAAAAVPAAAQPDDAHRRLYPAVLDAVIGPDQPLYLELVLNGVTTGRVVPVRLREGDLTVRSDDLPAVLDRDDFRGEEYVSLGQMEGITVEYVGATQRLNIDVPPDWLPLQRIGERTELDRPHSAVDFGMLLNYGAYTSRPESRAGLTSLWTEQRIFDTWGHISNTGIYRHRSGGRDSAQSNGYLRYDTYWRDVDEDRSLVYTAGDLVTDALPWSNAVRLGGINVGRDFTVRPDIVTYPLPQFSGQAAIPSAVDLFIDGTRVSSGEIKPGPFTFDTVPLITGAGEAQLVTTDALGRQVTTTLPFYVASSLLRKGLSTWSLSAGGMRRGYGVDSFSYGRPAFSGTGRYGLTDTLTLEGHAEAGKRFGLGGLGLSAQVGRLGVISLSRARSHVPGRAGNQYAAGYSYSSPDFSFAFQRIKRDDAFTDLSHYDAADVTSGLLARTTMQATAAFRLKQLGGTLGVGYFDVETRDGRRTRVANLSYNRSIFNRAILHASLNRTLEQHGTTAQLQLIIPLGKNSTVSTSLNRFADGAQRKGVQYSRNVPSDGGFGVNLAYADGDSRYRQAGAVWRNRYFETRGGIYGEPNGPQGYTRWLDVQGSVVAMDGRLHAANRVGDAFVLVDTDGYPDVPVRYENQLIGKTDGSGHLLVPSVPSWYAARYEIDTLVLPPDVSTPKFEQRTAVRAGSGAILRFPITKLIAATVILTNEAGEPLPPGSLVQLRGALQPVVVGWDGMTYLEGLSAHNHLQVMLPDGSECEAAFDFDRESPGTGAIGPLVCEGPAGMEVMK